MAKRVVYDASLTAVADAIREYPKFSEAINFPDGFVSSVQYLVSMFRGMVDGTFAGEVFIPVGATKIRPGTFHGVSGMTSVHIPEGVTSVASQAFWSCSKLTTVKLPTTAANASEMTFAFCSRIKLMDTYLTSITGGRVFWCCYNLRALTLRNTETVCTLNNTNNFESSPIASGDGYIYVPVALVDSYKVATNWSTYADQFRALEDYTVDGTTTGELDPAKI